MRYIVDRLEGRVAVCENELKEMSDIDRELLPPNVCAGDIVQEENGLYAIDTEATRERKEAMRKKLMDLFE